MPTIPPSSESPAPPPAPPPPEAPEAPAPARPRRRTGAAGRRRRKKKRRTGRLGRWQDRAARAWQMVNAVPPAILTPILLAGLAVALLGANLLHWVLRKPTELLAPVSDALVKAPPATWESYGPLFRRYATASVPAELLAALAQVESAGNPAAHTYWRWNPAAPDLFGIYRPASSSAGMFQMTEPAFADARRYCVRDHKVVAAGAADPSCGYQDPLARVVPAHAIELTAVWLDRTVAAILSGRPATAQQRRDLATVIHLCGAGPAHRFVRRGFRLAPGERCGDHDPAVYLAQVEGLERQFRRLAAGRPQLSR